MTDRCVRFVALSIYDVALKVDLESKETKTEGGGLVPPFLTTFQYLQPSLRYCTSLPLVPEPYHWKDPRENKILEENAGEEDEWQGQYDMDGVRSSIFIW